MGSTSEHPDKNKPEGSKVAQYDTAYGNFASQLYAEIRTATYGVDIGQNSWLTAAELADFARHLMLDKHVTLLNIASGSGGPSIELVKSAGCSLTGIDINEAGIANANRLAVEAGLEDKARFLNHDASTPLPFGEQEFNAVLCIDAINHLPDRLSILHEFWRVLKPGGKLLYTDPIVMTGPITDHEMSIRSSIGFFLFVPKEYNKKILQEAEFDLLHTEDKTENMATMARRYFDARQVKAEELKQVEGEDSYKGQQQFFDVTARLAEERRLSRLLYLAKKPGG